MKIRAYLGIICLLGAGCGGNRSEPAIVFTRLPASGEGSAEKLVEIAGRVSGAQPGEQVVLYARSGVWWVQPLWITPYTAIQRDFTWKNNTHPGTAYAALLVKPGYRPASTIDALPAKGGAVRAVASVEGANLARPAAKTIAAVAWELGYELGEEMEARAVDPAPF